MTVFSRAGLLSGLLSALLLFSACDYGTLGDTDRTDTYVPGDSGFGERMAFFDGVWGSRFGDGYHVRRWGDADGVDATLEIAGELLPDMDGENPVAWDTRKTPGENDFVLLYEGAGADDWASTSYMGIVHAVNVFNGDPGRGAIVIEYFEGADPEWLSAPGFNNSQGLVPGEVPFFGIHYRVIDENRVQMANAVDLAALYAGKLYYVEQRSLKDALRVFSVENDAEWIDWGIVMPQERLPQKRSR